MILIILFWKTRPCYRQILEISIKNPVLLLIFPKLPVFPKLPLKNASLFSVVYGKNTSIKEINNDLWKISPWAYQWKMSFNPDPLKQPHEEIFSRKMTKTNHLALIFNENSVHQAAWQKHLEMLLDCKLNFEEHLKTTVELMYFELL